MGKKTIAELVTAARAGDTAAFDRIVERFRDMVYGYSYAMLRDFHLAEDATQEAFVEAYYNLRSLRTPAAFPGWLQQIVRHRCSRMMRQRSRQLLPLGEALSVPDQGPSPVDVALAREVSAQVARAIGSLSQPQREAATLTYIDGYSQQEIAEFLGVPVNTIKSRLSASRQHLKERMEEMVKRTLDEHKLSDDFAKKIQKRLGRPIAEEEHQRWHREHPDKKMTYDEHQQFMKKTGITEAEDREWHKKHAVTRPTRRKG